ncbi:MAG: hypothetical protein RLP09_21810, partial [Sandaracinaceae bacterium]
RSWRGCAAALALSGPQDCDGRTMEGWDLARRFDEAEVDGVFVVAQLAFLERDGSAGRFVEAGRFRAWLDELRAALGLPEPASVTLLAHSAGFETALAILDRGGAPIRSVVLFDALYRGYAPFADWVEADPARRLVSLHTGGGRTASQSAMLARRARRELPDGQVALDPDPLAAVVPGHRVVVARSPVRHGDVPARHLAELARVLLPGGAQ